MAFDCLLAGFTHPLLVSVMKNAIGMEIILWINIYAPPIKKEKKRKWVTLKSSSCVDLYYSPSPLENSNFIHTSHSKMAWSLATCK